jgi:hypothetical protein
MILTVILGVVSAALAAVIVLKLFKDAAKEEKLDKIATVVKAGVDQAMVSLADGAQIDDAIAIIKAMIDKIKEL